MASFNSVVLTIAIVILVICLALIGWGIYDTVYGSDAKWPPIMSTCPDFWTTTTTFSGGDMKKPITMCNNTLKLGKGGSSGGGGNDFCDKFNIHDLKSACSKHTLASACDITWDGFDADNISLTQKCNKNN